MHSAHSGDHIADDVWQQYWDGMLTETEAARVRAHAHACPACRRAGDQWQQLFALVDSLPDEPLPAAAAHVPELVAQRIRRERRRRTWIVFAAGAAGLALVYAAAIQAAAIWAVITAFSPGLAAAADTLAGLLVKGTVRLWLWGTTMPAASQTGIGLGVVLANLLLVRLLVQLWERNATGGMNA